MTSSVSFVLHQLEEWWDSERVNENHLQEPFENASCESIDGERNDVFDGAEGFHGKRLLKVKRWARRGRVKVVDVFASRDFRGEEHIEGNIVGSV